MGLGKTLQLLACMSQNPPRKHSKAEKTLIVVPKRLLWQWRSEIKRHWSKKKKIRPFVYEANSGKNDENWEDHDIM